MDGQKEALECNSTKNENVLRVRAQNEHDLLFAQAIGEDRNQTSGNKIDATLSALYTKRLAARTEYQKPGQF